jgi:hypothetical protein
MEAMIATNNPRLNNMAYTSHLIQFDHGGATLREGIDHRTSQKKCGLTNSGETGWGLAAQNCPIRAKRPAR